MDIGGTRSSDSGGGSAELAELQREWQARRERAIAVLKERGVWQRLLDGKHLLRYIYSGIIEIDYLKLDEASARLNITETQHDAIDLPYIAFILTPGTRTVGPAVLDDWFVEGSAEYQALEALMVCF